MCAAGTKRRGSTEVKLQQEGRVMANGFKKPAIMQSSRNEGDMTWRREGVEGCRGDANAALSQQHEPVNGLS